jgi:hypothetical protein
MPIQWTVSHPERLVTAKVSGEVGRAEFDRYFAELAQAGVMPYRKILDLTFAPLAMSAADVKALGRSIDTYAQAGRLGALAIVVDAEATHDASAIFGESTRAERPFGIFRSLSVARTWLDQSEPAPGG